eukprot:TRINITY_DN1425_c0_g1_i19.p1 TRINITY_DN1425_c0_g1~~TRINITY_DN1425_c0_g1_i19.p1  ORF type:complete len:112 (-),score=13.84 TRINITY_DN1425_c0_g1_i19:153-488(-)
MFRMRIIMVNSWDRQGLGPCCSDKQWVDPSCKLIGGQGCSDQRGQGPLGGCSDQRWQGPARVSGWWVQVARVCGGWVQAARVSGGWVQAARVSGGWVQACLLYTSPSPRDS